MEATLSRVAQCSRALRSSQSAHLGCQLCRAYPASGCRWIHPSSPHSSVQLPSCVRLFAAPWTAARQASLSITNSRSLPKLISIESVMPFNHLILCHPLLLLPSLFPSIRVFSKESVLRIRWPKYWSFSPDRSELETQPSSLYHCLLGILTYALQRTVTVLVVGFVFSLGLSSLRLKAALGRDLATRVHGATVPFRGAQEALKCALSFFVIKLSFLFTQEQTEAWITCDSLAQGHTLHKGKATHLWSSAVPPNYKGNPTRNCKISSSHIKKCKHKQVTLILIIHFM